MANSRQFDVVVFGASGFTGQYVLQELLDTKRREGLRTLNIAAAGRNEHRVKAAISSCLQNLGDTSTNPSSLPILVADTKDPSSLERMTASTRVLINCTGPFRFHGEAVVKACIMTKTDYVDISGEPQFSESIAILYNDDAVRAGCLIVPTCGFDCIPADIGTILSASSLPPPAVPFAVDAFISLSAPPHISPGIHYTTYEALVHSMANADELRSLRKSDPRAKATMNGSKNFVRHNSLFFDKRVNKWCYPFMGADAAVVRASQRVFLSHPDLRQPAVHFATYMVLPSLVAALQFLFFGFLLMVFTKFERGRKLLLDNPKFFSKGLVTHEGPSKDQIANTSFTMDFFTQGYSDGVVSEARRQPDVFLHSQISGPEPGYDATPVCVVASALSLLDDRQSCPFPSGVFTPAVAFLRSERFRERLRAGGVNFRTLAEAGGEGPNRV